MFYARRAEILIQASSVQNFQQLRNKSKIVLVCTKSIKNECFKRVLVRDNETNKTSNKQQAISDNKQHVSFISHSGGDTNGNQREYQPKWPPRSYISRSRYCFSVLAVPQTCL